MGRTLAANLINAGFTDVLVMAGPEFRKSPDMVMMQKAGLRMFANIFIKGIFRDFPYDEHPDVWNADEQGNRHKRISDQAIADRHPALIDHLQTYFSRLFNERHYVGFQMDVEGGITSGCTPEAIEAFRKWCGYSRRIRLNPTTVQRDLRDLWISFRNRQAGQAMRVIADLARKDHPNVRIGYYGGPSMVSHHKTRFRDKYFDSWVYLRDVLDYGSAGYDFPMVDVNNTWRMLGYDKAFYPGYMIIEHHYDRGRKYRPIAGAVVQNLIAGGMKGYMIWYACTTNNGTLHDIAQVNDMLAEHEDIFFDGRRSDRMLALSPAPSPRQFLCTTYSKGSDHVAVIANPTAVPANYKVYWRGVDRQPKETVIRTADGVRQAVPAGQEVAVPAKSFLTLSAKCDVVRPAGRSGELYVDDFELRRIGQDFHGPNGATFVVKQQDGGKALETICDAPGGRVLVLSNANKSFDRDCGDYSIRATIRAETEAKTFGKVGVLARRRGKESIFGGVVFANGICWAQSADTDGNSGGSHYVCHSSFKSPVAIELTVRGQRVLCKVRHGGYRKTVQFETTVVNAGPPALVVQANTVGKCYFDDVAVCESKPPKPKSGEAGKNPQI